MSVADPFMLKLYFKKSYFCEEFFVVETFDQFKISKKQNQQSAYCGGFQPLTIITKRSILDVEAVLDPPLASLYTCPVYVECHRFELVFYISIEIYVYCKKTQNKPF